MVARGLPVGAPGLVLLVAAALFGAVFALTLARWSSPPKLPPPAPTVRVQQSVDPALMMAYQSVLRNMTVRVQTAEQALQRIQDAQEAIVARTTPKPKVSARQRVAGQPQGAAQGVAQAKHMRSETYRPPANAAQASAGPEARSGAGGAGGQGAASEEEEEFDEAEAEKRSEMEEYEQKQMIGFNEADGSFQRRFRSDFKCGSRVPPLPDDEVVECDPWSSSANTCCSSLGWCGASRQHCKCETCVDYRLKKEALLSKQRGGHAKPTQTPASANSAQAPRLQR